MNDRKKVQIFVLVSIISMIIALAITYKITNPDILLPEPEITEYPVSSSKSLIRQRKTLDLLAKNINNKELIKKYIDKDTNLNAIVEGNTIVVKCNNHETTEEFKFISNYDSLSIIVPDTKKDLFINIFKIMIEANQKRLGNNLDLTTYYNKYLTNNNVDEDAIKIIKSNTELEYSININTKIVNN